jgi:DNA polymerase/3'-5' exonuclease PolX
VAAAPAALRSLGDIQQAPAAAAPKMPRKLVRTVDLDLTVAHTTEVADAAQQLAARLGGYVASMSTERSEEAMHFTITLRVPAERLDAALSELKRLALRIDREQQKTDDVTDQYVDLDARLRTLRATEGELQALLAESRQRQRGAKEIMEIFRELTEIRTRIEQIQGQLAVLDKLSALSTINLRLVPPEAARPVAGEGWQPLATLRGSLRTLIDLLRGLGDFAIFAVIVLLPVALILAALVYFLRRLWRLVRRREPAP